MRIDLPGCGFKNCRFSFDGNCTKKVEYERCEYRIAKDEIAEAEPVRSGRRGMCKTHDNGYGRINLYSGGGWQTAICKGVENYEMVISHNGDHFATRIDYCPYCGERLDVK